jgi:hypothetical protein
MCIGYKHTELFSAPNDDDHTWTRFRFPYVG